MWSLPTHASSQSLFAFMLFASIVDVRQTHAFVQPPNPSSSSHATCVCTPNMPTPIVQNHEHQRNGIYRANSLNLSADSDGERCTGLSDEIMQAAEQLLAWEVAAERQSRAVLDLSGGGSGMDDSDLTLSDAASVESKTERIAGGDQACLKKGEEDAIDWRTGNVWAETRKELINFEILSDGSNEDVFLSHCPQLARIPTRDVVGSAKVLLDINTIGLSPSAIAQSPILLSYPAQLFPGALEFLSNMMMLPQTTISSLCKTNSELFIGGLDGYIQEQSVKNALGSAGNALYGVSRSVANDVGKTMRDSKAGPKGL